MTIYILGSGQVDLKLAEPTIRDYAENKTVVAVCTSASWLHPIADSMDMDIVENADFTATDTVLATEETPGVEDILKAGAVVLDLAGGLVPLMWEEDSPEVPEVPDIPDTMPTRTPPVLEPLPKKRTPRKPAKASEPTPQATTPPAPEKPVEAVTEPPKATVAPLKPTVTFTTTSMTATPVAGPRDIQTNLERLVYSMILSADEATLWKILDLLRGDK
jgi:outer membrane biosynthesis protein TonB